MFTSCVQTVLHLQPHTLKVSFATLQLLYQLCAVPACPIPQQSGVVVVDIFNACLVNPFLQYAPDLVVDWVQIGAVEWPQIWWNKVWRLDFQEFDSFASPMHRGPILLKCEVIGVLLNIWQDI